MLSVDGVVWKDGLGEVIVAGWHHESSKSSFIKRWRETWTSTLVWSHHPVDYHDALTQKDLDFPVVQSFEPNWHSSWHGQLWRVSCRYTYLKINNRPAKRKQNMRPVNKRKLKQVKPSSTSQVRVVKQTWVLTFLDWEEGEKHCVIFWLHLDAAETDNIVCFESEGEASY